MARAPLELRNRERAEMGGRRPGTVPDVQIRLRRLLLRRPVRLRHACQWRLRRRRLCPPDLGQDKPAQGRPE